MAKIRVRKRGKTYSYSFDISKKPRRMKEKGGFATEQEAFDAGTAAYAAWKTGNVGITSAKVTLDEFVASWLENVVKGSTKQRTYEIYKYQYRAYMSPYVGMMLLQDVRPRDIDRMVKELAGKGLSHGTISAVMRVAHIAFKYAIYPSELIQTNPTEYIKIPKTAAKKVIKRTIISKEQFSELLAKFPFPHRYRILIMIAYYTGMRLGEVLGLAWDDISLEKKTISVSRQLCPATSDAPAYFDTPKTATSARTVYIGTTLLSALKQWRTIQNGYRLKLGIVYQIAYEMPDSRTLYLLPRKEAAPQNAKERSLVCTDRFGIPVQRTSLIERLRTLGLNTHSFRHTHATRLIEAGAKPVDVAARLGHADATITQNLYTHDTVAMQKETAALTDKIL
ncbi:site-specific recombinase, phage integrase family [Selenomonas sp. FOBRC9]|nr:site-specific recombinase, phage integrase family [Selenomonas sp. FOBRC9]